MPSLIIQSLQGNPVSPEILYSILSNSGSYKNIEERGLGDSFKKNPRPDFIEAAFSIDEEEGTAEIKNPRALNEAAHVFLTGRKGVNQNFSKAALLFALILSDQHEENHFKIPACEELKKLYQAGGPLAKQRMLNDVDLLAQVNQQHQLYKSIAESAAKLKALKEEQAKTTALQAQQALALKAVQDAAELKAKQEAATLKEQEESNRNPIKTANRELRDRALSGDDLVQPNLKIDTSQTPPPSPMDEHKEDAPKSSLDKLLELMIAEGKKVHLRGNTLYKVKTIQKGFFGLQEQSQNYLSTLSLSELKILLKSLNELQSGNSATPAVENAFEVIRVQRGFFTGCINPFGYTNSLQEISHAIKKELLEKLKKEKLENKTPQNNESHRFQISENEFKETRALLSSHYNTSFFGRWGKTTNVKTFEREFEVASIAPSKP